MTPDGKLIFHVFGALAESERDLIQERTNAGLAAPRARWRRDGPSKVLALVRRLYEDDQTDITLMSRTSPWLRSSSVEKEPACCRDQQSTVDSGRSWSRTGTISPMAIPTPRSTASRPRASSGPLSIRSVRCARSWARFPSHSTRRARTPPRDSSRHLGQLDSHGEYGRRRPGCPDHGSDDASSASSRWVQSFREGKARLS